MSFDARPRRHLDLLALDSTAAPRRRRTLLVAIAAATPAFCGPEPRRDA